MSDLKIVNILDKIPTNIVDGLWNGEVEEHEKEHLNMVAHGVTNKNVEELIKFLQNKKNKDTLDHSSVRGLVILFYAILEKGGELAYTTAKAYILLLQVPTYLARDVLHPYALRLLINLLKRPTKSQDSSDPFKDQKKRKKQTKPQSDDEMDQEETTGTQQQQQEENSEHEEEFFPFATHAEDLMRDLVPLLSHFSLELYSQSLLHIIEVLAHVSRSVNTVNNTEKAKGRKRKTAKDQPQLTELNDLAYNLLSLLLRPIHGTPSVTFSHILKELLPNMLHHYHGPLASGPIPKHMLNVRADTVKFVLSTVKSGLAARDEDILDPIHVFLQHICTRVADRAEYRSETSAGVCELLKGLPIGESIKFLSFLSKLSKTSKANQRHLSVEVAVQLLLQFQEAQEVKEAKEAKKHEEDIIKPLVEILVKRSSDKVATIRAKALGYVATVVQHANGEDAKLFTIILDSCSRNAGKSNSQEDSSKTDDEWVAKGNDPDRTMEFLRRRVQDEKSGVRKSALQVLEALYMVTVPPASVLAIISSTATDSSPLIRKQVVGCLTALTEKHEQIQQVFDAWRRVVFPLVADRETTVQDKALEAVSSVMLSRIVVGDAHIWQLMNDLDAESCRYLHRVCSLLVRKKSLPDGLVKSLMKAIANDDHKKHGAWILLSELAPCCPKQVDNKVILQKWGAVKDHLKTDKEDEIAHAVRVLRIVESVADIIPASSASSIAEDIYKRLSSFSYPPALVHSFISVLGPMSAHNNSLKNWPATLVTKCDDALSSYIVPQVGKESKKELPAAEIERYLFTLGEVVQAYDVTVSGRVVTVVQSLLAPDLNSVAIPSSVRAHAFVVLGKLCLASEPLAKRCITVFARELETSKEPVIRNNVMVVMCDLCIRYTAIVDRYIPNIAVCLRDESELVRRQTLLLLTRLLQEDYVKWKGQLFYRFVVSLVDPSAQVREFAQYCLVDCLYTKHPTMFFSHFLETIFVLNDYRSHPVYNQAPQTEKERTLFSLKGEEKRRMGLYTIFLSHMTDEQKFQLTAKICHEVIGDLVDGKMALSQSADVLQDSLMILASKDIKLSSSRNHSTDDAEDEQESAMTAAKGKLLSKIVKKNILENIVPILIELKHLLEKHRSPLLKYLMMYLKELLKDFKSELQDIVVGDKQLAKELEYDLRMWDKKTSAPTVTMMSPPQVMFSPKPRNTPRPDFAKFSVPKLRPSPSVFAIPKTPNTANGPRTPFAKTPLRTSSDVAESPYKTPMRVRASIGGALERREPHIVFTPEPSRQRRWSIELPDENDQNRNNVLFDKELPVKKASKKDKETPKDKEMEETESPVKSKEEEPKVTRKTRGSAAQKSKEAEPTTTKTTKTTKTTTTATTTRETRKRAAKGQKGKLTFDEDEDESESVPAPTTKRRRARA